MDYRYILLIFIIIVILWFLYPSSPSIPYDELFYQDQGNFDGDYQIIINQKLYNRFVEILLNYAYQAKDQDTRTLYIYLATFQIFNVNFHAKRLERLDQHLTGSRLVRDDISYPSWTKYHNLQAVIANLVGKELTNTERDFTGDREQDKKLIDVYLTTLFDLIGIVRID